MPDMTLPCIVCKKSLQSALGDNADINQPYDANCFHSSGHYGSTLYDSMGGNCLEVNICSECMRTAANEGLILELSQDRPIRQNITYTQWTPEPIPLEVNQW